MRNGYTTKTAAQRREQDTERRKACTCPERKTVDGWRWLEGIGWHGEWCSLWRPVMTQGRGL